MFRNRENCKQQCTSCKLASAGKKPLSHLVQGVMGETHFVLNAHLQQGYFSQAQSAVIPGPVATVPGRTVRRRSGALVVGYMGVLEPHKGVDVLADAACLLGADCDMEFVIAGTGQDPAYVESLKQRFGAARVRFLGWTKAALAYPQFDVLVVPSRWNEPFGRIVVEAFAYGVPVVCSRSGGLPESVRDGYNGLCFGSGNAKELAHLLAERLGNDEPKRLVMAHNALRSAADFAMAPLSERLDTLVHSVVERHRTAHRKKRL